MEILFVLLPLAVLISLGGLAAFFWAMRRGQFTDLDTPPLRMVLEEEQKPKVKEQDTPR